MITALGGQVLQINSTQLINDLLNCLNKSRCLLIIDNLETLLDESHQWKDTDYEQFFCRWLEQGHTSTLLITTQEKPRLFKYEPYWKIVDGFTESDGISLLQKLGVKGDFNQLQTFTINLDGHPLTLRLVSAFLCEYFNGELKNAEEAGIADFDKLANEAVGFHRGKQDVRLIWILREHIKRLTLEQQKFLVNISVYRQPFDQLAATYMLSSNEDTEVNEFKKADRLLESQRYLRDLLNRSLLLETQNRRYQIQPLVHKYVLMYAANLTISHMGAIKYYSYVIIKEGEKSHNKSRQIFEYIESCYSLYVETFYHYCELKEYDLAYGIVSICQESLELRGYNTVLIEMYERLLQEWKPNDEHQQLFGALLNALGDAYIHLDKHQQAIICHQSALEISQEFNDQVGELISLNSLGSAYRSLTNYEQAINYYKQSLFIAKQIKYNLGEFNALVGLGNVHLGLGNYQAALILYREASQIDYEQTDKREKAVLLLNIGNAHNLSKNYQEAFKYYKKALSIYQESRYTYGEATTLFNLGNICIILDNYEMAINYLQEALIIYQRTSNYYSISACLIGLTKAYFLLAKYDQVIEAYLEFAKINPQKECNLNNELEILHIVSAAYQNLDRSQEAINYCLENLQIAKQLGNIENQAVSLGLLASIYNSNKDYLKVVNFYGQCLELMHQVGNHSFDAIILNDIGNAYRELREYQKSLNFCQRAIEIANKNNDMRTKANAAYNLGLCWAMILQRKQAIAAYKLAYSLYVILGLSTDAQDALNQINHLSSIKIILISIWIKFKIKLITFSRSFRT